MNTTNASAAQSPQITAGPWAIVKTEAAVNRTILHIVAPHCHTRGSFIALVGHPTDGDHTANARLIAAAPDLLAALQKIVDFSERTAHCTLADLGHVACAAIAKAEGNS